MMVSNPTARDACLRGLKNAPRSRVYDDLRVWRSRDGRDQLEITTRFERRYYRDGFLVHVEPHLTNEELSWPDYPRPPGEALRRRLRDLQ